MGAPIFNGQGGRSTLAQIGRAAPQGGQVKASPRPGQAAPAPQPPPSYMWGTPRVAPGTSPRPATPAPLPPPPPQPAQVADRPFYGQRQAQPVAAVPPPPPTGGPAGLGGAGRIKPDRPIVGSSYVPAAAMAQPMAQFNPGMRDTARAGAGLMGSGPVASSGYTPGYQAAPSMNEVVTGAPPMSKAPGSGQTPQIFGTYDAAANAAKNERENTTRVQGQAQADTGQDYGKRRNEQDAAKEHSGQFGYDQNGNPITQGIPYVPGHFPSWAISQGLLSAEQTGRNFANQDNPNYVTNQDAPGYAPQGNDMPGATQHGAAPGAAGSGTDGKTAPGQIGQYLGDVAQAATDVLSPAAAKITEADTGSIKNLYGWDEGANDFSSLSERDRLARDQFGSGAMDSAEQAAQDKLNSQIGMQRDAEMRQLLAAQGRGGAVSQGRFNTVNNSALMAQQAGQRDLAMDAYTKRRQAAQDLLAALEGSDDRRKAMLGEGLTTTSDLAALGIEGMDKFKLIPGI